MVTPSFICSYSFTLLLLLLLGSVAILASSVPLPSNPKNTDQDTNTVLWIHSLPSISIGIDSTTGMPVQTNTSYGYSSSLSSLSWLGEQQLLPTVLNCTVQYCGTDNTDICVYRYLNVTGQQTSGSCCRNYIVNTTDIYTSVPSIDLTTNVPSSIRWTFAVTDTLTSSDPVPWRTSIITDVTFNVNTDNVTDTLLWVPQGGTVPSSQWSDPLPLYRPFSTTDGYFTTYGQGFIYEAIANNRNIMPIPLSMAFSISMNSGIALFHDPSDALIAAYANITIDHHRFVRLYNRLGSGASIRGKGYGTVFSTYIVPIQGLDWRPVFKWSRAYFPSYFLSGSLLSSPSSASSSPSSALLSNSPPSSVPPSPVRSSTVAQNTDTLIPPFILAGQGIYSCADIADMNTTFLQIVGATHNWDAHFFWPYIGMYMPPNETWTSNTGGQETTQCGSWKHGDTVSRTDILSTYTNAAAQGIVTLPYYNLFEIGENVEILAPPSPPVPLSEAWPNSSVYIAQYLNDAIVTGPIYSWQNSIVLDPAAPAFSSFLVNQITDKINSFGSNFYGIAIDRMDHTTQINRNKQAGGDGWDMTWCGSDCRFLLYGWQQVVAQVSQLVYTTAPLPSTGGRLITINYVGSQRIDTLNNVDGVFTEDFETNEHYDLLSIVGLSTTGKPPAMVWTYDWNEIVVYGPDNYMQTHLYMKAFPCTPVMGADHTITYNTTLTAEQQLYLDYGPMFNALKGGCWHVDSSLPVLVSSVQNNVVTTANAFTVGGGCTSPLTNYGNGPVTTLVLFIFHPYNSTLNDSPVTVQFLTPNGVGEKANPPASVLCESFTPGDNAWTTLPTPTYSSTSTYWSWDTPLVLERGCMMVRCTNKG